MKAWSVIGLPFGAILATIPISPQATPRGVELRIDQAQAQITYGRYRRVTRRVYRRGYRAGYYGVPGYYPGYYYGGYNSQPIGGGGGQWYPW